MANLELKLHFGALAPKLSEQLSEQNLVDKDVKLHEKIIESFITLYLHNYITETHKEKIVKKLFNDIKKKVKLIMKE
jgi:hypothetical protein